MVQNIEENGLLDIICLGGIHNTNIPAHSVIVKNRAGKKIRGITTSKPVHFLTAAERADNSLNIEDIRIDVGASSRREVMEDYGVAVGDPVMPDVKFEYDEDHGICYGKAFDNRLGCVSILSTMKALQAESEQLAVEVVGGFAAQEEVGTRGAQITSQQILPDLAIVFEGSPADDFYFRPGIAAGTHVGTHNVQFLLEHLPGIFLIMLQHGKYIPAVFQLLCDGGNKTVQLSLDLLSFFPYQLFCFSCLLIVDHDS